MHARLVGNSVVLAAVVLLMSSSLAFAHFGMVIPSQPVVTQGKRSVDVVFSFSHPRGGVGMELVKPARVGYALNGAIVDLAGSLEPTKVMGHPAWKASMAVKRPGVYSFFMEPKPYWEPAEDCSIIHYTKVIVPAFGDDAGWDEPVGLKTEIVPLLRPFGNFAGNTFVGKVLVDGKAVPNAEVEVELYDAGKSKLPTEYHETQVIKADSNGVFSFSCPTSGWWGFAALTEADFTLANPVGEQKSVELGGVIWVYFDALQ